MVITPSVNEMISNEPSSEIADERGCKSRYVAALRHVQKLSDVVVFVEEVSVSCQIRKVLSFPVVMAMGCWVGSCGVRKVRDVMGWESCGWSIRVWRV